MAVRKPIRVIAIDDDLAACLDTAELFRQRHGADVAERVPLARDVVRQTLDLYSRVHPVPPWSGYLTVDVETNVVVGCCGFTGSPSSDAGVEIAYFTFPPFEGRGFATAMALELVETARTASGVRRVIAHTLPTTNASTRVLEKCGFRRVGDGFDPDAGPVWQWGLDLATTAPAS